MAYLGGFASICQAGDVISKLRAKQDLLVFCYEVACVLVEMEMEQ